MAKGVYTQLAFKAHSSFKICDCTDKGKPAVRRRRKAVNLTGSLTDFRID